MGGKQKFRLRGLLLLSLALLGLLSAIIACLTVLAVRERPALTRYALARIAASSGAIVNVQRVDFALATNGIEVIAHRATLTWHGDRLRTRRAEAVIGYGALARLRVLPLESLRISTAEVILAPRRNPAAFDFNAEAAQLSATANRLAHLVRRATLRRVAIVPPGQSGARLMLDARVETGARRVRVRVARARWNGQPLDGLAGSAVITIAAARPPSVHGALALYRNGAQSLSAHTTLNLSQATLSGSITFQCQIAAGPAAFTGSYKVSADRLELVGTWEAPANSGLARPAPLRVSIAAPFSANPQLSAQAGPLELQIAQVARALGRGTPSATGNVVIQEASLALALGPLRDALGKCADASCRKQRLMAALIGGLTGSLTVADARIHTERPGLRTIIVESPARVTLSAGAVSATALSVRAGAARFDHVRVAADLRQAMNVSAPYISYSAAAFAALDLSRLDLRSRLSPAARRMLPAHGVADAQLTIDGMLADSGAGFAPRSVRIMLRQGFLRLRDRKRHEEIMLRADATLANERLRYSARAELSSGGTLVMAGNYGLARRALDARISFHALDLRRWTRGLLADTAMPGLTVDGQAGGEFAIKWRSPMVHPQFNGSVAFTALEVGSQMTAAPVFINGADAALSDGRVRIVLHQVQLGAGNFDVNGTVANFAQPKIDLSITGRGFDLDAIKPPALAAGRHRVAAAMLKPPAHPMTLHARVTLRRVFIHHVALRGFAAEVQGSGGRWEIRDLSAYVMRGVVKTRAAWDQTTKHLYLTGNAYHLDAHRMFARLAPKGTPPVTGRFNARFNVGMVLIAGAPPQPLCGSSTIRMTNGTLGNFPLLSDLMSTVSLSSWLSFIAPNLDVGMPYDHITARMALTPHALEVRHMQLSSDAFGLAGRGSITLPARILDLHIDALPLSSIRGLLAHVPLAGARSGRALDRIFAVRVEIKGPAGSPEISPVTFRNPLEALTSVIEAPLAFLPDSDLPPDSIFTPPAALSYRKSCSPYQW
ncbi:MAG: hypothetical protein ACYDC3_18470 [Candidatus Binataceae bacterium]